MTLLTGFLGSGKTTLLNSLLADDRMRDTAVIVNEFGSISIDHDLVHIGREGYAMTSTGCLCCTALSDVRTSLYELYEACRKKEIPDFKRVVIETTGLADPAPIINSLIPGGAPAFGMRDHIVARAFQLTGVITTFDAENGGGNIQEHFECWKQLAFADHIVLTKTDLLSGPPKEAELKMLNPSASLHDGQKDGFNPYPLIGRKPYSAVDKPEDVIGWIAMERFSDPHMHSHDHDPNRHGADITALPLTHEEPLDPAAVNRFLETITSHPDAKLLRLKGIFALTDDPSKPLVAHAVQHRLYPTYRLDHWPDADQSNRMILIGKNLPIEPITELFNALKSKQPKRRWFSK
ncbi:CobW family GTP-binding protein [Cohaesibacter celericrescens]|uniref:CobW family GTP-binding protein n=1 Tax=Cohaesibacter celericrescens TaxID=2067669 RepID=UPI001FDF7266|nr:GTP-binding protein [Cohaesibacter celericrescens]